MRYWGHIFPFGSTSQVTRTTVAYGSRNQNRYCSCGNRLRSLESVVCINSAGRLSTKTGFRALLFRQAFFTGTLHSKLSLTLSHKSLTSSTVRKGSRPYEKESICIYKLEISLHYCSTRNNWSDPTDGYTYGVFAHLLLHRYVQVVM